MKLDWKRDHLTLTAMGGNAVYPSAFEIEISPEGRAISFENGKFMGIHPSTQEAKTQCQTVQDEIDQKTPPNLRMN